MYLSKERRFEVWHVYESDCRNCVVDVYAKVVVGGGWRGNWDLWKREMSCAEEKVQYSPSCCRLTPQTVLEISHLTGVSNGYARCCPPRLAEFTCYVFGPNGSQNFLGLSISRKLYMLIRISLRGPAVRSSLVLLYISLARLWTASEVVAEFRLGISTACPRFAKVQLTI